MGKGHNACDCPNRRQVLLNEQGEYESDDEHEEESPLEEDVENFHVNVAMGECFVVKRTLITNDSSTFPLQHENIFHTRCFIQGKVCNVIIDGGSCCNIID